MMSQPARAHPFMPNSAPALKSALLAELGLDSAEPLFGQIPESHRFRGDLTQPESLSSEVVLSRHMRDILARNRPAADAISFLGGGCWHHYVPAVVDEIVGRSEFTTPVWGTPSSDFGRNQAWFEFTSQIGALVEMDMVGLPVYSWGCAAGHAIRMAVRITDRQRILVPARMCPQRRAVIDNYCGSADPTARIEVTAIACDEQGRLDVSALAKALNETIAAVYFENPSYLGGLELAAAEIAASARSAGAETIVGVDPISLGVVLPPGAYGADIVVGTTQPLGVHMSAGGGLGGFIATRHEPHYASEYPTLLNSITETVDGNTAFGLMLFHQSSYGSREYGKDWTGNSTYLWAIANSAYMGLMGPQGFQEIGALIASRAHAAASRLSGIPGLRVSLNGFFKEFVVNFDETGRSVSSINDALRAYDIFGGLDLSQSFPDMGQTALYCVTEVHEDGDIERLVAALTEVLA